ncbi:MAG: hypothetical protein PVJ51_01000 [Acidobacteriota bacterium]|jgi:hypothetical protein
MLAAAVSVLLVHTAVGMLIYAAISRSPAGPGFYRLSLLVGFGCLVLGFGLRLGPAAGTLPGLSPLALAAYGLAAVTTFLFILAVAAAAGAVAVLADPAVLTTAEPASTAGLALFRFGLLSAALSVGGVLFAMLLAHWYLVEPRMPTAPLQRSLLLFGITEVAILASLFGIVAYHWPQWTGMDGGLVRAFTLGNALFVAMRTFLGVLAPIGLAWMTWKTVEIRSIQSATGILYAAVVFVLFGETICIYLSLATGQPY